jgi:hypothetical protein
MLKAPFPPPPLTERFLAAVELAAGVHGCQRRTGTEIPYLAHLLVVTGLVLEDGGDEDEAIAAMLHDAVEDGGGRPLLEQIEARFGDRVAVIVEACSDTVDLDEVERWIERKRRYLEHLPSVIDDAILRVALADKVHNARSIVRDYREEGHALWERFTQKTAREQLWYYGGLLAFFEERRPGPLTEDLLRAVTELAWLVARDEAEHSQPDLRLWVDRDLHAGQAPKGWVQVRTPQEAVELMQAFRVRRLSFEQAGDAHVVIDWLVEEIAETGCDWTIERIALHGEESALTLERLGVEIERHSALRWRASGDWANGDAAKPKRRKLAQSASA